jgi:hypothetical protein
MLEAVQKNWFSNRFHLLWGDEVIGGLSLSNLRGKADLELGDERFRCYREGFLSGAFHLEQGGVILACAEKPGILQSRFSVRLEGRDYLLKKRSALRRTFYLLEGGDEVGSLHRSGFLSRRVESEFPAEWPLAARAFVIWLALVVWTREDAAV